MTRMPLNRATLIPAPDLTLTPLPNPNLPPTLALLHDGLTTRPSKLGRALLIPPVRVVRVFQVPQRATAVHGRNHFKVVRGRRRRRGPFQRPGVPRVITRQPASAQRGEKVVHEDNEARRLDNRPYR